MLIFIKEFILFLLSLEEEGTPWQFSKQISKLFFQFSVQVYSLLGQSEQRGKPFKECTRRGLHCEITLKSIYLVVRKEKKGCPFLKFEIILPLLCRLSDSLTNKHYRVCISMINLGIDSRTCQKCRILMSARLGDCKRKGFWECDAVILTMCYLIILHDMVSQNP